MEPSLVSLMMRRNAWEPCTQPGLLRAVHAHGARRRLCHDTKTRAGAAQLRSIKAMPLSTDIDATVADMLAEGVTGSSGGLDVPVQVRRAEFRNGSNSPGASIDAFALRPWLVFEDTGKHAGVASLRLVQAGAGVGDSREVCAAKRVNICWRTT